MTALWIAAAIITLAVLALVLRPLLRGGGTGAVDSLSYDLAVYRDQLAEVDREAARGLLDPRQADAARLEIQRRILTATASADAAGDGAKGPHQHRSPILAAGLATVAAVGAFALYLELGAPDAPDQPLAARQATPPPVATGTMLAPDATLAEAIRELERHLEANPGDGQGWFLLGRSYLSLEQFPEAVSALRNALDLAGQQPEIAAEYGEAIIALARGRVTAESRNAMKLALIGDPLNARARYYLALDRAQQGDYRVALQGWADLLALSPPGAPWRELVQSQMARAAAEIGIDPGAIEPSPEALALAEAETVAGVAPPLSAGDAAGIGDVPEAERAAMVRDMVDRLAARLEAAPDDAEGWRRLARAYQVLGEPDKAAYALERAEAAEGS
ncbi:MAG: c-type cytochrome biogenesis protein CcmI [Rhodospirillales bacterium]|nr:MAG: c-type cytochrome biogenesis protein CcmI [Rhodospirillales bacterium]